MFKQSNRWIPSLMGGIAFLNSALLGISIWYNNPDYLDSLQNNINPDAKGYSLLAKNLFDKGLFTKSDTLEPEPNRTPGYPFFILLTGGVRAPIVLYVVQCGLWGLSVGLLTQQCCNFFGVFPGAIAGAFLLLDLSNCILCWQAMTEISSFACIVVSLYLINWPRNHDLRSVSRSRLLISGFLLAFGVLIRPTYIACAFLPILTHFRYIFDFNRFKALGLSTHLFASSGSSIKALIIFGTLPFLAVAGWTLRNFFVFGLLSFTPISNHSIVYYVGSSALEQKFGISKAEAQSIISERYNLPTYGALQNAYTDKRLTVYEMEKAVSKKRWVLLAEYPRDLCLALAKGFVKTCKSHSIKDILSIVYPASRIGPMSFKELRSKFSDLTIHERIQFLMLYGMHFVWMFLVIISIVGYFYWIFVEGVFSVQFNMLTWALYSVFTMLLFGLHGVPRSRMIALPLLVLSLAFLFNRLKLERFFSQRKIKDPEDQTVSFSPTETQDHPINCRSVCVSSRLALLLPELLRSSR